jgi:hypothetical protein
MSQAQAVIEYRHADGANQLGDELGGNGNRIRITRFTVPVNSG